MHSCLRHGSKRLAAWCPARSTCRGARSFSSRPRTRPTSSPSFKGVIAAEEGAIAQYNKIIKVTEGVDYVTQDMVIGILGGEEDHRREFIGFLKEYEKR